MTKLDQLLETLHEARNAYYEAAHMENLKKYAYRGAQLDFEQEADKQREEKLKGK